MPPLCVARRRPIDDTLGRECSLLLRLGGATGGRGALELLQLMYRQLGQEPTSTTCTALLEESCAVTTSTVTETSPSGADKGFKLVVRLASGKQVETVAIVHTAPSGTQGRITVCVSSQVGCKMGCTFCATGTMGFQDDLSAGEILEQARRTLGADPHPDY